MKLISWNCRGLGNGPAIRGLLDLQKKEDPDVLFLSKTKMEQCRLEWLRWKMNMTCLMVKNCEGQSGGLAMFWKREVNLRIVGFMSKYHIDAEITEDDGFKWRFMGIYGEPKMNEKDKTWHLMRNLKHQNNKPWLCAGDFNEVLHSWEKEGGFPAARHVWIGSNQRSKCVNWVTSASQEMPLLGGTTTMLRVIMSRSVWIGLWLTHWEFLTAHGRKDSKPYLSPLLHFSPCYSAYFWIGLCCLLSSPQTLFPQISPQIFCAMQIKLQAYHKLQFWTLFPLQNYIGDRQISPYHIYSM